MFAASHTKKKVNNNREKKKKVECKERLKLNRTEEYDEDSQKWQKEHYQPKPNMMFYIYLYGGSIYHSGSLYAIYLSSVNEFVQPTNLLTFAETNKNY